MAPPVRDGRKGGGRYRTKAVNSLILRGQCHEPHVTAERAEVLVLFHALPQIGFRLVREREFQVAQCLVALALQRPGQPQVCGLQRPCRDARRPKRAVGPLPSSYNFHFKTAVL